MTKAASSGNVSKCVVTSNQNGKKVDVASGVVNLYWYESVLQETCRCEVIYIDSGNNKIEQQSVIEGLPIVGQENVELSFSDASGGSISMTMYVNKAKPLSDDTRKSCVEMSLVSKEFYLNEQSRVNIRFDGKPHDHVTKIHKEFLKSEKPLDAEPALNNYNFIGNNRKPFYNIVWLAKKTVPATGVLGDNAGYFYWERAGEGFKFWSIEKILSQGPKADILYNETTGEAAGKTKAVSYEPQGQMDVKDKIESGFYSSRVVMFDPFTCYYEVVERTAKEMEPNYKLAATELPKLNPEFGNPKGEHFTKTTYMLIDKGTLPTGSTQQQIDKSKEQNFDPKNILNQSTMRYNQLFAVRKEVVIPGNFSLKAGDMVKFTYAMVTDLTSKSSDVPFTGLYMIADLCHYMDTKYCYTKMNLVRDSITPPPTMPAPPGPPPPIPSTPPRPLP